MFPFELSFLHVAVVIVAIAILLHKVESRQVYRRALETSKKRELLHNRSSEDSVHCPVHFGFLKKLPVGSSIPEECYSCNRIAKCGNRVNKASALSSSAHRFYAGFSSAD